MPKTKTDAEGFQTPVKTVRPSQQASSLAIRHAVFLHRAVVPQVPPPVALDGGSQGPGADVIAETKRQLKRQRAKRNRHARREAMAERLHHCPIGDPADDSESDDDGSAENFRSSGDDRSVVHCADS